MHNTYYKYAIDTNLLPASAFKFIYVPTLTDAFTGEQINLMEWIIEDDTKIYSRAVYFKYIDIFESDTLFNHPYYLRLSNKTPTGLYRYIRLHYYNN